MSSWTINVAPRPAQSARNASACRSLNFGVAVLFRYWIVVAPPLSAAATHRVMASMSERSGVSAYKPAIDRGALA
jgi:hypothetical protein